MVKEDKAKDPSRFPSPGCTKTMDMQGSGQSAKSTKKIIIVYK